MAGPQAGAGVAVKILVEEQQVAPMRVFLKHAHVAKHRPPAVGSAREEADEAVRDFPRHVARRQRRVGRGGCGDGEARILSRVEFHERLNQEK